MNTGESQSGQELLQPEAITRPGLTELPVLETTGQRVAWLREYYGMSLQDFGRRIGYDGSQISRIERNRCQVVDRFIRVVCIQFRVQESWLRHGHGPAIHHGLPAGEDASPGPMPESQPAAPSQVETLVISSQEWQEAWTDLRSYVDLLDKLSPVARAELAPKLHQLVTRVCDVDDADGAITISTRLRESDDSEPAPRTADGEVKPAAKPRSPKKATKPEDNDAHGNSPPSSLGSKYFPDF